MSPETKPPVEPRAVADLELEVASSGRPGSRARRRCRPRSIASAIIAPIAGSPDEIVGHVRDLLARRRPSRAWRRAGAATTCSTASSIPRRSAIGCAPAATLRMPVADERLRQQRRGRRAVAGDLVGRRGDLADEPRALVRSKTRPSSISPAIVAPSLVIVEPALRRRRAARCGRCGPSVTLTASATASTPACSVVARLGAVAQLARRPVHDRVRVSLTSRASSVRSSWRRLA